MITMFYDKYLNGECDGAGMKQFGSHDIAMSWVREQSTGTTGIHTIENIRIFEREEENV